MRGQRWLAKYYTSEENSDSVKCNVSVSCEEVFSYPDREKKLKDHLCDIHNITKLDTHPKRGFILQNYVLSKYEGTCNHCNRKIKFKRDKPNMLIRHLKCTHPDKWHSINTRDVKKRVDVWNKFDVNGRDAKCKTCQKVIKHNNMTCHLRSHLRACENVIRRSNIWNKFDVNGRDAKCKTCQKVIKHYNNAYNLKKHLGYCENVIRKSNIWNKFDVNGRDAKCKTCQKIIKHNNKTYYFEKHLRACKPAPTSSSSMRDNDFHLNELQNESTIRTSTPLLGRQGEEIKESDGSYLSSESDEDSIRLQLSESSIDEIEDGYGYIYRFEKRK
ncbi:uncharacterized protein [Temnothorax longispinosus]|uniref:uncharacterized protein isoform X2 n=1 Tax=Temnothorax longispinosus TaxID=300112 RepID=UPI003A9A1681